MAQGNAGAEWIDRYLMPQIGASQLAQRSPMRCLQFGPDDDEEAERLRQHGHLCHVVVPEEQPYRAWEWHESPVVMDWRQSPLREGMVDLVFSPWFGHMAQGAEAQRELAVRMWELLRPGGAMLLSMSNRQCPVDLIAKRICLPGARRDGSATLREVEESFAGLGARVKLLNVRGHFRWGRLPRKIAFVGPWMDRYLGWASQPQTPWRYGSIVNPLLMIWIEKATVR